MSVENCLEGTKLCWSRSYHDVGGASPALVMGWNSAALPQDISHWLMLSTSIASWEAGDTAEQTMYHGAESVFFGGLVEEPSHSKLYFTSYYRNETGRSTCILIQFQSSFIIYRVQYWNEGSNPVTNWYALTVKPREIHRKRPPECCSILGFSKILSVLWDIFQVHPLGNERLLCSDVLWSSASLRVIFVCRSCNVIRANSFNTHPAARVGVSCCRLWNSMRMLRKWASWIQRTFSTDLSWRKVPACVPRSLVFLQNQIKKLRWVAAQECFPFCIIFHYFRSAYYHFLYNLFQNFGGVALQLPFNPDFWIFSWITASSVIPCDFTHFSWRV